MFENMSNEYLRDQIEDMEEALANHVEGRSMEDDMEMNKIKQTLAQYKSELKYRSL